MSRQTKTPQQRAEETVAVIESRLKRTEAMYEDALERSSSLEQQVTMLRARLDYARQNPDLASQPSEQE